jgi:hypothetical protein
MSETATRTSRGPAAPRLYGRRDPAVATAQQTGVPVTRTAIKLPPVTAKSFRLPSGVQVSQTRIGEFARLCADHMGRIARADREELPKRFLEAMQGALDMHFLDGRDQAARHERALAAEWRDEQHRAAAAFHADREVGGKKAAATLASAHAAIAAYERTHGSEHAKALKDALSRTGAGNDRHVIRFIASLGHGLPDDPKSKKIYS